MWDKKKTKNGSYRQLMNPIRKAMLTKHMFCRGKKSGKTRIFLETKHARHSPSRATKTFKNVHFKTRFHTSYTY
jgi:hypothetical protein